MTGESRRPGSLKVNKKGSKLELFAAAVVVEVEGRERKGGCMQQRAVHVFVVQVVT